MIGALSPRLASARCNSDIPFKRIVRDDPSGNAEVLASRTFSADLRMRLGFDHVDIHGEKDDWEVFRVGQSVPLRTNLWRRNHTASAVQSEHL